MDNYKFDPTKMDYAGIGGGLFGMIDSISRNRQTDGLDTIRPTENIAGHIESPIETLQRSPG